LNHDFLWDRFFELNCFNRASFLELVVSFYGDITHKAILVDAAGTRFSPPSSPWPRSGPLSSLPSPIVAMRAFLRFMSSAQLVVRLVLHVWFLHPISDHR
jgi:hypothetical protein